MPGPKPRKDKERDTREAEAKRPTGPMTGTATSSTVMVKPPG